MAGPLGMNNLFRRTVKNLKCAEFTGLRESPHDGFAEDARWRLETGRTTPSVRRSLPRLLSRSGLAAEAAGFADRGAAAPACGEEMK